MLRCLAVATAVGSASAGGLRERPASLHAVVPGVSGRHKLNPNLAVVGGHMSNPDIVSEEELDAINNKSDHSGFNQTDLSFHLKEYLDKHAESAGEANDAAEGDDARPRPTASAHGAQCAGWPLSAGT